MLKIFNFWIATIIMWDTLMYYNFFSKAVYKSLHQVFESEYKKQSLIQWAAAHRLMWEK